MELLSSRYYYSLLNDNDRKIYNEIYKAILEKKTSVPLRGLKFNKNTFGEVIIAINYDNPQFYYVEFNKVSVTTSLVSTSVQINYYYDVSKILELNKEISEDVQQIIRTEINEHQSDYDKVLRLHDKLKFMSVYDMAAAKEILLQNGGNREAHTIVGMFINRKCVCEAYAKSMHLLCTMVGIESILVFGTAKSDVGSGPHSWNLVKINGYYHHVDVTWDSQYSKDMTLSCYGYLNLSDSSIGKDHIWDSSKYPKSKDEPYNYFKMNDAILSSNVELEKFLHSNFENEEEHISFKINERNSFQNLSLSTLETIIFGVSGKCKYIKVDRYEIGFMESQNVFVLHMFYRAH